MKQLFPLITLLICSHVVSAQQTDTLSNRIIQTVKKSVEEFPQEKIYLHLDRPYYLAGDTIWFKAYQVAGSFHQPSPLCMTIHVELTNERKEIVNEILIKSDSGYAAGNMVLHDSLPSGSYLIRAFTPWMRNFPEEYFYHRNIPVFNLSIPATKNEVKDDIDVQFFPESGNLILGIKSKVAFKATGADGLARKVKVEIYNERDSLLTSAESNDMGMGAFSHLHEKNKKYFARVGGKKIALPIPMGNGFSITVTNLPDKPFITLRLQSTDATLNKQNAIVLCQTRGIINYVARVDISHNLAFAQIPKSNLLSGISTITLFNGVGQPVAERLIFIDNQDNLIVNMTTNKKEYKPREKVTVEIQVTDQNQKPVQANLSLAVSDDLQAIPGNTNPNIVNHFLLASDLVGIVENPGYYFDPSHADRLESLDFLMLTQGWRRFQWQSILQNKWPNIQFPIDKGLSISGKLKDIATKKNIQGGKVTFLSSDPASDLQIASTNEIGEFKFYNLIYFDSTEVVLQGENRKGNKTVIFDITKEDIPPSNFPITRLHEKKIDFERSLIEKGIERKKNDLKFDQDAIILKSVEISGKKIEEEAPSRIYGQGNSRIVASEIPGSQTYMHPLQYLQGRMAGVQVTGSGLSYNVSIRGVGSMSNNTPLIMVDNTQVDMNTLASVPARMIESVEVFKGPEAAIFGSDGANGAILFYTKKGTNWKPPTMGIYNLSLAGYQAEKEYYSPKYTVSKSEQGKPDIRATVFWASTILTDESGRATISFYTNDNKSTITGIIEGISPFGKLARGTFNYRVVSTDE